MKTQKVVRKEKEQKRSSKKQSAEPEATTAPIISAIPQSSASKEQSAGPEAAEAPPARTRPTASDRENDPHWPDCLFRTTFRAFLRRAFGGRLHADRLHLFRKYLTDKYHDDARTDQIIALLSRGYITSPDWYASEITQISRWRYYNRVRQRREANRKRWQGHVPRARSEASDRDRPATIK